MLVWETLPGTERAQKGARPSRSAPLTPTSKHRLARGGLLGEWRGKFLSGPFPIGENGWHVRGLETEEETLTAVRGGGYSGLLRRPVGGSREEVPEKLEP